MVNRVPPQARTLVHPYQLMDGSLFNQTLKQKPGKKLRWQNLLMAFVFYAALTVLALIFLSNIATQFQPQNPIDWNQLVKEVESGQVEKITVNGNKLVLSYKSHQAQSTTFKDSNESLVSLLEGSGVKNPLDKIQIEVENPDLGAFWGNVVGNLIWVIPLLFLLFFGMRQARQTTGSLFDFGRARIKLFEKGDGKTPPITFADAAGVDEAKQELTEVVDFLKNPEKYRKLGARIPKGVLLVGPSGAGKTLLAKALAGEAGVPFYSMAGSEFMEMLVGVGPSVTGDTPILVRINSSTKLTPIGEFVDQFYADGQEGFPVSVQGVQTLGFEKEKTGFWGSLSQSRCVFGQSAWQNVQEVYRHKADEIYEIHFLGGMIRATGEHSIFVRRSGGITPIAAKNLKAGDILVDLPLNIREEYIAPLGTRHKIKAHQFPSEVNLELDFWDEDEELKEKYEFALAHQGRLYQHEIADQIGFSQMTVSNWQRGRHTPQALSRKLIKFDLPDKVLVTPALMKLFGYYTAEGRCGSNLEFTFGIHETQYHAECIGLMHEVFNLKPVLEETADNTLKIKYYSHHLGRFFARYCGNGSHNKHVPEFIWDLPREYFLAYLEGYVNGDGEITKEGKVRASSVSRQLILELAWLCNLHGIGAGIGEEYLAPGRVIRDKPLPETRSWRLIIGKTSNPFLPGRTKRPFQIKRAIVKKIVRKPFRGYVYDLCGCKNEAFFGGEKPILLHNSRVRDLFSTAKANAPAIIFIDEIESIGRQRGMIAVASHGEQEQTLNQILVEMDGFEPNTSVIVVAATNRPDLLDPALTRPGRFDRRVVLELPDIKGREEIIKIHMQGKPFSSAVSLEKLARRTVGFSGADIENMLNEAAILAARAGKVAIEPEDLEEAATKVKLGPQRKRLQTEEDKRLTAYHEAGHAIVARNLPHMDPVHRVSIISRGLALGYTEIHPEIDRSHQTKTRLLEMIITMLGGRAAEILIFDEMTVGAASDLESANRIARKMVMELGMSNLGPLSFGFYTGQEDWRRLMTDKAEYSDEMAAKIDEEVKKILEECLARAQGILQQKRAILDKVAEELVQKETLEGEEFEKLIHG